MNALDAVKKINAEIAALPKEYHALIVAEQTWTAKHPTWTNVIKIGGGFVLGVVATWII